VERTVRLIQDREREEIARSRRGIVGKRLHARSWVPAAVRDMLSETWVRALANTHLAEGEGSPRWQALGGDDGRPPLERRAQGGRRGPQAPRDDASGHAAPARRRAGARRPVRGSPPANSSRRWWIRMPWREGRAARDGPAAGSALRQRSASPRLRSSSARWCRRRPPGGGDPPARAEGTVDAQRLHAHRHLDQPAARDLGRIVGAVGSAMRARLTWISPAKGVYLFTNPLSASNAVSISPDALASRCGSGRRA
jgi:hypothetical protein